MRLFCHLRWRALLAMTLLALSATGCGGLAAAGAISPLQLLFPALVQNQPTPPPNAPRVADASTPAATQLAQAR